MPDKLPDKEVLSFLGRLEKSMLLSGPFAVASSICTFFTTGDQREWIIILSFACMALFSAGLLNKVADRKAEQKKVRDAEIAKEKAEIEARESEYAKNKAIFDLYKLLPEDLIEAAKPFLDGKTHTVLSTSKLNVLTKIGVLEQIAFEDAIGKGPVGPVTRLMVVSKMNPAVLGMINADLLGMK